MLKKYISKIDSRKIFVAIGILIIFLVTLKSPTDPDMGWHLANGKYLIAHHLTVAKKDIFSHSMPEFPLIMHEWVTDIWMFVVYQNLGLFVLSCLFAVITTLAFLTATLGIKTKTEYKISAAMLAAIASLPVTGLRPQMLTLLGLALVIYIILSFRQNPQTKKIFWLPFLFLFWANSHGGFAVGLFFIAVFLAVEIAKQLLLFLAKAGKKKFHDKENFSPEKSIFFALPSQALVKFFQANFLEKFQSFLKENTLPFPKIAKLAVFLAISTLATLVNPYSWRVYIEIITTIFDKFAKANIGEWLPVSALNPMSWQFLLYLFLFAILLLFSWRCLDYTYLFVTSPFLYLGFSSWRHLPVFLIVSTPLWVYIVKTIVGEELRRIISRGWFLAIFAAAGFFIAKQQIPPVWENSFSLEKLAENGGYPLGAVKYLRENPLSGNMFNEYNWGGFLIWQLPEKKVYIDGRMPSWRVNGFSIFEEFNNTVHYNEGWEKTLEKYNISFALLYNNWVNDAAFSKIGWKKVYSDNIASIYQRPSQ